MPNHPKDFKTIARAAGPALHREKKSKFLGYAFPVSTVETADEQLTNLRKLHAKATHVCYAYRIGIENTRLRMNDDGEPAHSAGSTIFGQITSANLFDVLVCVVRYYGGVKLGVGGLTKAYREAAKGVLEISPTIRRKAVCLIKLQFQYPHLDEVMGFISQNNLKVSSQKMKMDCAIELIVSPDKGEVYSERFRSMEGVQVYKKMTYR